MLLLRYQPRFSDEFVNFDYLAADKKCLSKINLFFSLSLFHFIQFFFIYLITKEIVEALHLIGQISIYSFDYVKRFLNTNKRHLDELITILDDLVQMIEADDSGKSKDAFVDDTLSLDFTNQLGFQTNNNFSQQANNSNDELLSRKLQILDDAGLYQEFRCLLQYGNVGLIPPDMTRIIKCMNETSDYLRDIQYQRGDESAAQQLLAQVRARELESRQQESNNETTKIKRVSLNGSALVSSTSNQLETIQVNKLASFKNFDTDVAQFQTSLTRINDFFASNLSRFEEINRRNQPPSPIESSNQSIGDLLSKFKTAMSQLNEIGLIYTSWHSFIEKQIGKQKQYEKCSLISSSSSSSSSSSINSNNIMDQQQGNKKYKELENCIRQISDLLNLLLSDDGAASRRGKNKAQDVDKLLFC